MRLLTTLLLLVLCAVTGQAQIKRISQEPVTNTVADSDDLIINKWVGSTNYATRRIAISNFLRGASVTNAINDAASNRVVVLGGTNATVSKTSTNGTNFYTVSTSPSSAAAIGVETNQFTTNVAGRPVIGSLWLNGTNGLPGTNEARSGFEYIAFWKSLRVGQVDGGASLYGLFEGNGSNYWNNTNIGPLSVGFGSNAYVKAAYASVLGGSYNVIGSNANFAVIAGGNNNLIDTNAASAVIGGGGKNSIRTQNTGSPATAQINSVTISGGSNNLVGGSGYTIVGAVIGGGGDNILEGQYSIIDGGLDNQVQEQSDYASIGGGLSCRIGNNGGTSGAGNYSTIGGGRQHSVQGQYGFIGGGRENRFFGNAGNAGADYNTICGGASNKIGILNFPSVFCFVGGGHECNINDTADYSVIGGGRVNSIGTGFTNSVICGGAFNIMGGNKVFGQILGGERNTITGTHAWTIGDSNNVGGDFAGALGRNLTNTQANTVGLGSFDGKVKVYVGGKSNAWVGGTIFRQTGTAFTNLNAAGTLSNLASVVIDANSLTNLGDTVTSEFGVKLADSKVSTNRFQLTYGGSTPFDTGAQSSSNCSLRIFTAITRTGNASQHFEAWVVAPGAVSLLVTNVNLELAENNGVANTLALKGGSSALGSHTNNAISVKWEPGTQ